MANIFSMTFVSSPLVQFEFQTHIPPCLEGKAAPLKVNKILQNSKLSLKQC